MPRTPLTPGTLDPRCSGVAVQSSPSSLPDPHLTNYPVKKVRFGARGAKHFVPRCTRPTLTCQVCGDHADAVAPVGDRCACRECWNELILGIIPGPEILSGHSRIPASVGFRRVNAQEVGNA